MILTVDEIKAQIDCDKLEDKVILTRLKAIENVIRKYTNNNFQNRHMRFTAKASGGYLLGASPYIRIGDTIQVSQSGVNDGLYVVTSTGDDRTTVDGDLFDAAYNVVTKIVYPDDVVMCAIDLFKWHKDYGGKIGIKSESETLSRHSESVTYEDSSALFMGYPTGILSGLKLYCKARF